MGSKKQQEKPVIENVIDLSKDFKHKEQIAKNKANKDLINSFYPRTYPGTLKSTYIF